MDERIPRRVAWTVALVAAFTMTVSYVDRQTLAVLSPTVTAALGLSETQYGWLQSAFNIAYLVAVPLAGWWIGRIGARRGLAISVLTWSCVAALHAVVPGFAVLFALRIALGVAEGPSFPGAALTMYRVLPAADRARGYSLLFTGSSVGSMVAPLLVTWLLAAGGWKIAFLGTAMFGLCWLPLWLAATRRADVREVMDGNAIDAHGSDGGARYEDIWAALRRPATIRALIAVLAVAPTVGFGLAWSAKVLVATFAVDKADVGYYLWLPPLALDLGAIGFGDLLARYRTPRRLVCVAVLLAGCIALLPLTSGPWQASVVFALALAGGGGMNTLLTGDLLGKTAGDKVSTTAAVLTAGQSIALIAANPLMGWAADNTGGHQASAIGCALWLVPGVAAWLVWRVRAD
jgi:ACS family hexuronate transporter-like MFS transporter